VWAQPGQTQIPCSVVEFFGTSGLIEPANCRDQYRADPAKRDLCGCPPLPERPNTNGTVVTMDGTPAPASANSTTAPVTIPATGKAPPTAAPVKARVPSTKAPVPAAEPTKRPVAPVVAPTQVPAAVAKVVVTAAPVVDEKTAAADSNVTTAADANVTSMIPNTTTVPAPAVDVAVPPPAAPVVARPGNNSIASTAGDRTSAGHGRHNLSLLLVVTFHGFCYWLFLL
jgi:hypothetical protein